MKQTLLATAAVLLSITASAQPGTDCSKARDPTRCVAWQQLRELCKESREKRRCMHMPPPDCSKAGDQARCEARQKARLACQGKPDKEMHACLKDGGR